MKIGLKNIKVKMKNKIIYIFTFILAGIVAMQSFAQQAPKGWQLLGEGKGNEVRLLWTATQWTDTIQGMIIKRRVAGGSWTTLTASPIYPLVSSKKNLSNVSNDASIVAALKKKMADNPADYT